MADGKLNGQKAFMSGKLKVKGNIMLATSEFNTRQQKYLKHHYLTLFLQSSMVCSRPKRQRCKALYPFLHALFNTTFCPFPLPDVCVLLLPFDSTSHIDKPKKSIIFIPLTFLLSQHQNTAIKRSFR
jgi:hypothetical protein